MTELKEFKKDIKKSDEQFKYMLLSRMQIDCDYFLGYGNGALNQLWGRNIYNHIHYMKILYKALKVKPEWLTMKEIRQYRVAMFKLKKNGVV